ncbi:beta-ketoacyl synthase N-terminal-like domain-containing protein [Escherichia coli]
MNETCSDYWPGLGIVSSIGNNQQEVLASLREERRDKLSQELKDSGMRSHVWGNVKLDTTGLIDRKVVRFMSDASIYAFLSMEQAIADAGLSPEAYQNNPRVGLIAGSGGGSRVSRCSALTQCAARAGLKAVGPYVVTKAMASGVSACLATPFKIHGVNYSISSACATSAHCIGNAVEQIQLGKQDIVFGGGEELCWEMACEFDAMGALSTKYNDTPEKASRTYDAHRDGCVYRWRRRYGSG